MGAATGAGATAVLVPAAAPASAAVTNRNAPTALDVSAASPTKDPTVAAAAEAASGSGTASANCELLAVGDSLTDPKSHGGAYLEGAKRSCGCSITNLGRGGDMVNQMRARLVAHLAQPHAPYRVVVVFGGVNDLYSDLTAKRTVEKISADLERMYRASRASGARVIAVTVAPWGGFRRYFTEHRWQNTRKLNAWIRGTPARGLTDGVVDAELLLSCGDAERLCEKYALPFRDGLHFGPEGHRRLSSALVQALGPAQCADTPDRGSIGG